MKDLKGTKTEKCLQDAFAGESMAHMKYIYYSSQAKKDGFVQISNIFAETSGNEKEHAELWFKYLQADNKIPNTITNLKDAAAGEHFETTEMYPSFAKIAEEEGFTEIAREFKGAGAVESEHEARYDKLAANIENNSVFARDTEVLWQCINCGHIQKSKAAPDKCPVCQHPQAYFQLKEDNF
ncbi:MAG: rubrerythrin family protein [Christensenella sp.]